MQAPDIFIILGIVFGTTLVGYVFGKITGLVKTWINRNNAPYDEEKFERLAKAFIKYKKDSERRFQNLEAMVTNDEMTVSEPLKENSKETIQIETEDSNEEQTEQRNEKLPNMLNKQRGQL